MDLEERCDVIMLCVSNTQAVQDVTESLLPHLRAGQIIVDFSSISPDATQALNQQAAEQVEIMVKYEGYIQRQQDEIDKSLRHEHTKLPIELDYSEVKGLSNEVVVKLTMAKPETLGIASRISGITPAAISILLVHLKKQGLLKKGEDE